VPQLAVDDLCGAVFNPVAGTVTPDLVVQGCARDAAHLGARVEQSCAVERVLVENGRVAGVETARGRIATDCVVLTAGVWSRELAATAGGGPPPGARGRRRAGAPPPPRARAPVHARDRRSAGLPEAAATYGRLQQLLLLPPQGRGDPL